MPLPQSYPVSFPRSEYSQTKIILLKISLDREQPYLSVTVSVRYCNLRVAITKTKRWLLAFIPSLPPCPLLILLDFSRFYLLFLFDLPTFFSPKDSVVITACLRKQSALFLLACSMIPDAVFV